MNNQNELVSKNLIEAIKQIAKEKELSEQKVADLLAEAFKRVFLKNFDGNIVEVKIDLNVGTIKMYRFLKVVSDEFFYGEGEEDDETLIPLSQAEKLATAFKMEVKEGTFLRKLIPISKFDKITVRQILSSFKQMINETVNKKICAQWIGYKDTVLEGKVEKIDIGMNNVMKGAIVDITNNKGETTKAYISKQNMISTTDRSGRKVYENLEPNSTHLFYVKDVKEFSSGWPINLSRTHADIVKTLLSRNVVEIADKIVEIKSIARIAGARTKVFVTSNSPAVDPVGACLGPKAKRLKDISNLLLNEKIDILRWSDNTIKNIITSLTPGMIIGFKVLNEESREILLITEDHGYLTAIGRQGVNVKLACLINNWNIDIKKISEAKEDKDEYEPVSDLFQKNDSFNVQERIFEKHHASHDDILKDYDDEDNEDYNY